MKSREDALGAQAPTLAHEERQSASAVTEAFIAAFRHHPAGVAILTGDPGDGPVAVTVSSLISVSATPPMVAFSLSESSSSARRLLEAETIVVHFARRDDVELAQLCATGGASRFGPEAQWARLSTNEPFYPQVATWFRAAIRSQMVLPGARLVAAEILSGSTALPAIAREKILVYVDRAWTGLSPNPISAVSHAALLLWPTDSAMF